MSGIKIGSGTVKTGRSRFGLIRVLACGCLFATAAAADRVETRSGVVYSNAVTLRVDAKGLVIRHAGGIATIPVEEIAVLSDGLLERQKQAQAREADRRVLMEARRAAVRKRWEACRLLYDELGERRTFAVLRKLRSADHRADMQSSSNLLYEINLGDRLPALLETVVTRFVEPGDVTLWIRRQGNILIDLPSGFDAYVPVYLEAEPARVEEFESACAELPCPACAASGRCPACAGRGIAACASCRDTGKNKGTALGACEACQGRLRTACLRCGGHGRCVDCGGRGKGGAAVLRWFRPAPGPAKKADGR
ncbi:MAG: hypothetical protein KJ579_00710 [Verrucomicrobia bacterium]|nr:hypothetical protein [Verrucomicrobiota bacterium]